MPALMKQDPHAVIDNKAVSCWWHQFSHAVTYTRSMRLNAEAELKTLAEKSTVQPTDLKLNWCCAFA